MFVLLQIVLDTMEFKLTALNLIQSRNLQYLRHSKKKECLSLVIIVLRIVLYLADGLEGYLARFLFLLTLMDTPRVYVLFFVGNPLLFPRFRPDKTLLKG